jgi:general secretion pathway protein B
MGRVCNLTSDKPMSYILDALKRADAERQRGQVPGLHAQQATAPAFQPEPGARKRLWLGVGAALALGAVAAGLWLWYTPEPAPDARLAAADPAQPGITTTPPASIPAPKPAQPTPAVKTQPPPKPKVAAAPTTAPSASAPAMQKPLPVAKAPPAPAAPGSIPLLSELPPDLRRQIPAITINGVVYSDNPGRRLLLVNQQVLTQGSQAVPEVSLEEIGPHNSVFSFRGTRFRMAH